jgi:hypothetical protein
MFRFLFLLATRDEAFWKRALGCMGLAVIGLVILTVALLACNVAAAYLHIQLPDILRL